MSVVLDTCALWSRSALAALATCGDEVVLPAVAYTERARQWLAAGRPLSALDELLRANHIDVEPFSPAHGLRFAAHVHDDDRWRRLAHDALIAGHLGPEDQLWTGNVDDFVAVGVPREQVVAV